LVAEPGHVDWDAAVRVHNVRVIASLVALSIPFAQAEELASQTWARLLEQERAGKLPEIRLPGLALRQARFLALTWLTERRREVGPAGLEMVHADTDPERALIVRRDVQTALGVIATCSRSAQLVFHLIYDHPPLTHEVVAERVGLSTQRVRQILCEVRKKIRVALEQTS